MSRYGLIVGAARVRGLAPSSARARTAAGLASPPDLLDRVATRGAAPCAGAGPLQAARANRAIRAPGSRGAPAISELFPMEDS